MSKRYKKVKPYVNATALFVHLSTGKLKKLSTDELMQRFHNYRGYYLEKEVLKDGAYYTSMYEVARCLIILLGEREHNYFSMLDIRFEEYFERANEAPLNGDEPKKFLEFLIGAKEYKNLEFDIDIDMKIAEIIEEFPNLKEHNFSQNIEDSKYFDTVSEFAKRTQWRSEFYINDKLIVWPKYLKHLYYEDLAEFMHSTSWLVLDKNAEKELDKGRKELSQELLKASEYLSLAQKHLHKAGALQSEYINENVRRSRSEHIFDPDIVKNSKIGQFAHSYMLTYRMLNERGDGPELYDMLKNIDYNQKLAEDSDFEEMIMGLIETFELYGEDNKQEIEKDVNRIIGRDVWKFQKQE